MDQSQLLSFFSQLQQTLEQLTQLQSEKIAAAKAHDLDALNACIKQEQVISLSLRGLEQKRDKLLQDLGLAGVKLLDAPNHCTPDVRPAAAQAAERLRKQYTVLRSAQEAARTLLEKDLRSINQELERRGVLSDLDEHYQASPSTMPRSMSTDFRA